MFLTLIQRHILDSSKLKEFTDHNFHLDEKVQRVIHMIRKRCGKKRNCSVRAISPIPTKFSKDLYCRHIKNQGLFKKGLNLIMCTLGSESGTLSVWKYLHAFDSF